MSDVPSTCRKPWIYHVCTIAGDDEADQDDRDDQDDQDDLTLSGKFMLFYTPELIDAAWHSCKLCCDAGHEGFSFMKVSTWYSQRETGSDECVIILYNSGHESELRAIGKGIIKAIGYYYRNLYFKKNISTLAGQKTSDFHIRAVNETNNNYLFID